jgi:hypothetical protein
MYDSKSKGRLAVVNIITEGFRSTEFDKFEKLKDLKPIRNSHNSFKESVVLHRSIEKDHV